MGSLRPNCSRMRAWISGGTLALVAASPSGSPGASARMVKSTRLIPASTGIEISRRRSRYLDIRSRWRSRAGARPLAETALGLFVPEGQVPEVRVPAALHGVAQLVADGGDAGTPGHRDHYDVLDQQIVHLDEQRRPLDRIQLGFGSLVEASVVLAAPPGDIASLPLVFLAGGFPGHELQHEILGVRHDLGRRVHLDVGVEVG